MSALHKFKAYFGMVPADEVDGYDERGGYQDDYRSEYEAETPESFAGYESEDRAVARRPAGAGYRSSYRSLSESSDEDYGRDSTRPRTRRNWSAESAGGSTRGALALDPSREPAVRVKAVPDHSVPAGPAVGRITTLNPSSYSEARTIGEHYRDGIPVIMNLTEMDDADAKRLVDFAAGLAFALRGSIDKVTSRVFLLSPPTSEVSSGEQPRSERGAIFRES
ncbi:DUF552 domain-containing protein [Pseudonocardiaceae bacterium YIM PH 21723]|nr:DUF552 domain-containing protein [Pseudonocardiaceae bacterium YIM PH 21723]